MENQKIKLYKGDYTVNLQVGEEFKPMHSSAKETDDPVLFMTTDIDEAIKYGKNNYSKNYYTVYVDNKPIRIFREPNSSVGALYVVETDRNKIYRMDFDAPDVRKTKQPLLITERTEITAQFLSKIKYSPVTYNNNERINVPFGEIRIMKNPEDFDNMKKLIESAHGDYDLIRQILAELTFDIQDEDNPSKTDIFSEAGLLLNLINGIERDEFRVTSVSPDLTVHNSIGEIVVFVNKWQFSLEKSEAAPSFWQSKGERIPVSQKYSTTLINILEKQVKVQQLEAINRKQDVISY